MIYQPIVIYRMPTPLYTHTHTYVFKNRLIGLVGKVFANGPGDLGSIPGRALPKTLKMVLDTFSLNTQHYMISIKGKVQQPQERSSARPYTSVL